MAIAPKWIFLGLVILAVGFEIVADVLFKKWALENKLLLLGIGLGLYFIGTLFWALSLREQSLSSAIVVFTILNLLAGVGIGILYFGEKISMLQQLGIGFGFMSVILLEWEG